MKKSIPNGLTRQEITHGVRYLLFQLIFLPGLLFWANAQLPAPFGNAELNFLFYLINFIAMLLIFGKFLGQNLRQATRHPVLTLQAAVLGYVAYYGCSWLLGQLMPSFSNYNDEAIFAMSRSNYFLILVGTVILVPPYEEAIYRGLIFRGLYGRSPWLAYAVSMVLFALIHITGYIGIYSPMELLLAVAQYLPAGICLAWAYEKSGSIFAPVLIHAAINFTTLHQMR